jgi:hypothetical protein
MFVGANDNEDTKEVIVIVFCDDDAHKSFIQKELKKNKERLLGFPTLITKKEEPKKSILKFVCGGFDQTTVTLLCSLSLSLFLSLSLALR